MFHLRTVLLFVFGFELLLQALFAQTPRLSGPLDGSQTVTLRASIHPLATSRNDLGPVDPTTHIQGVSLRFAPTEEQRQDLARLLARQQNPASPDFHKWLTPEQFGERFGAHPSDLAKISEWLQGQGLKISTTARGRTWMTLEGSVSQLERTFHPALHRYSINGRTRYANSASPTVPAALSSLVTAISGLNDIPNTLTPPRKLPTFTQPDGSHTLAPDDIATIYDITPLYQAGVDGTGIKLAIVGQTSVNTSDLQSFRTKFNLPAQNLQSIVVPKETDPGMVQDDLAEADLDIEWAGAVARNASIIYVYSTSAFNAVQYVIDQNLASVVSMSFGLCEAQFSSDLNFFQILAQQGNAEGITWVNASGDTGAAGCDHNGVAFAQNAAGGHLPATIPEVTGVGGTQFNEQGGNYWSPTNSANGASALSYIPETTWNEAAEFGGLEASGGGPSAFFPKPLWQTGPGVPADGFRDSPDVAVSAAAVHDGYYVFTGGRSGYFGGTSIAAPVFAGIIALLNQALVKAGTVAQAGLGNINPVLYAMAQSAPSAFHDITSGNNNIPCASATPGCSGGIYGFSAGPGYDLTTGLGSPDANNLVHQWSNPAATQSQVVVHISPNPAYQQTADAHGNQWFYAIVLSEEANVPTTLTGFNIDSTDYSSDIKSFFGGSSIPANGSISATLASRGVAAPSTEHFTFNGLDGSGHAWTLTQAVDFDGLPPGPSVGGAVNAASNAQTYAPGMIVTLYGSLLGATTQHSQLVPLLTYLGGFSAYVNSEFTPLFYVSPGQVNLQLPFDLPTGSQTLSLSGGLLTAPFTLNVSAVSPGLFTTNAQGTGQAAAVIAGTPSIAAPAGAFSNSRPANIGDYVSLYATGLGDVHNRPTLGDATPSSPLAMTIATPTVTIGGVNAPVTFSGLAPDFVGLYQINVQVPAGVTPGAAVAVIVTIANIASNTATIAVQ